MWVKPPTWNVDTPELSLSQVLNHFVFNLQENADIFYKEHHNVMGMGVVFMPSLIYAIVISIMNAIYRKLAKALNDWGECLINQRTEL